LWFVLSSAIFFGVFDWVFFAILTTWLFGNLNLLINILIMLLQILAFSTFLVIKKRIKINKKILFSFFGYSLFFILIEVVFSFFNLSNVSADSLFMLKMGNLISKSGFTNLYWDSPASYGYFVPVIHSVAGYLEQDYLTIFQPVLTANFLFMFCFFLLELTKTISIKIIRFGLPVVALFFLVSSSMMQFELTYIHSNLPTSIYLLIIIIGMVFFQKTEDDSWLIYSGIAIVAFSLIRTENPITVLIFVTLFIGITKLDYQHRVKFILPAIVGVILIESSLLFIDSPYLTEMVSQRMIGGFVSGLIIYFLFLLGSCLPFVEKWIIPHLHKILAVFVFLVLIITAMINASQIFTSVATLFATLVIKGGWELMWQIIIPSLILFCYLPFQKNEEKSSQLIKYSLPIYFAAIVVMSFIDGVPYTNPRWSSSPNRMFTQLLPMAIILLILVYKKKEDEVIAQDLNNNP